MKSLKNRILIATLFLAALVCGGCGGGADSQPPSVNESSNWDELIWDQGNWN